MVLECVVVHGGSQDLERSRRAFHGWFAFFCKLLRAEHHLRNYWSWDMGLWVCCCDIFCQVLAVWQDGMWGILSDR